ncbi:TPA: iron chelate uptake ABC transporter family permease subunit [Vibrio parahaemolyticus]|uniref:FecCD family ABC transporter permease n=1 Tax=Vibrio parahaemolyticus TaxID=670 RepID=UPI00063EA5C6|nr:iron ABC transporter permease [Vibrio parahaemolyticus]KLI85481.1 iron ABC transporter permease [Vibrio parahaemolyticus]HAS6546175.1 iron chelate uptake ABC transporter family permease subunit [Vibrio parahaemolyticus]HAS6733418.1 iron chelate uptake ABC transporter family permease subunit [Vibrio parahaemolyticus]HAS6844854.1 iron chelate uptake ABC transporter family permease subunit [Vibrio parahaemolyticus]HCM1506107.1 iron ABC transporter permease [Vibrio parahaemolyticus]
MLLRRIPLSTTLITLSGFLAFIAIASITVGPMNISFTDSLRGLIGAHSELAPHIQLVINEIRLPRTILCMFIGAILAICGVVMQGLFRNPLAEPGIIGVSAGAALGGAFAIVVFAEFSQNHPQLMNLAALPLLAFLGGALTTVLVYWLGTNKFGTSVTIMLLAGVAISALSGAAIGFLNFSADDQMLRDLTLWSMGSLAGANWAGIGLASVTLVVLLFWFHKKAMSLNALLLGESEARHLGVPVQKLKRQLILLSAVGVGVTVSICGAIGFIGLVIPHLGRMLAGPDHRTLLPISALLGALLLTCADMIARVLLAPAELPVGIVTALIGAPFFIYLLFQQRGKIL